MARDKVLVGSSAFRRLEKQLEQNGVVDRARLGAVSSLASRETDEGQDTSEPEASETSS
jgi:hypothetical protein